MFDQFFAFFGNAIALIYQYVPSYGLSIMILTLIVMIPLTPLTLKGTKSMLAMQRLQPELKKVQQKYKGDRDKMNQEVMRLYQENQINPLGGCLPLLVQAPVFIFLYQTVQGLTTRAGGVGSGVGSVIGQIEAGVTSVVPWIRSEQPFEPKHVRETTDLYKDLAGTHEMNFIGVDIAKSPLEAFRVDGIVGALPYVLLVAVILVTSVYQQRQIQGRNPNSTMPPQQQAIMKFLPYMLPVFSLGFPAALSLYFVVSNTYRIGQQSYITHKFYKGEHASEAIEATATEKGAKGSGKSPAKSTVASGSKAGAKSNAKPAKGAARGTASKQPARGAKPTGTGGTSARSQAVQRKAAQANGSSEKEDSSNSTSARPKGARPGAAAGGASTTRRRSGQPRSGKGKNTR